MFIRIRKLINIMAMSMNILQLISIFLEIVVAAMGILLATSKRKIYGWFIALTFVIYVFYDLANLFSLNVSQDLLYTIFLVATLSILWATWRIFVEAWDQARDHGSMSGMQPAIRLGLHDATSPDMGNHFSPHCCRHWFITYLELKNFFRFLILTIL